LRLESNTDSILKQEFNDSDFQPKSHTKLLQEFNFVWMQRNMPMKQKLELHPLSQ